MALFFDVRSGLHVEVSDEKLNKWKGTRGLTNGEKTTYIEGSPFQLRYFEDDKKDLVTMMHQKNGNGPVSPVKIGSACLDRIKETFAINKMDWKVYLKTMPEVKEIASKMETAEVVEKKTKKDKTIIE